MITFFQYDYHIHRFHTYSYKSSANLIGSTFNIYLESESFLPLHQADNISHHEMFSTAFSKWLNPNSGSMILMNNRSPECGQCSGDLSSKKDASPRLFIIYMKSGLIISFVIHLLDRYFSISRGGHCHHKDKTVFCLCKAT